MTGRRRRPARLRRQRRSAALRLGAAALAAGLLALSGSAGTARALVYASDEPKIARQPPADFPYWRWVGHFKYQGPSLVYLGAGYVLTAQHAGLGEVVLDGHTYLPLRATRRGLMGRSGSPADGAVFRLDDSDGLPDLPLLPLARTPPAAGEEVLMIGFGHGGAAEISPAGSAQHFEFGRRWTDERVMRWGTNRARGDRPTVDAANFQSRCFVTRFDRQTVPTATPLEAQPAVGDSGGPVFVRRPDGWKLAGIMISVQSDTTRPHQFTAFGDLAFHLDLSEYRSEIDRYGRPSCANGLDDDGDGRIDFPDDSDCSSAVGDEERHDPVPGRRAGWLWPALGLAALAGFALYASRPRAGTPG